MGDPSPTSTFYVPLNNWTKNLRIDMWAADQFGTPHCQGTAYKFFAHQNNWENPESNFSFTPSEGNPPAVLTIAFSDFDLTGYDESSLQLYRLSETSGLTSCVTGHLSIQASSR